MVFSAVSDSFPGPTPNGYEQSQYLSDEHADFGEHIIAFNV